MIPQLRIGPYCAPNPLIAAPMAGVTDRPFRQLSRRLGAGFAVAEMLTSDTRLWHTKKSRLRMNHDGEVAPIWVQIAGADPDQLAAAAIANVARGAQIIDINMGCPAKKVCNVAAGSALLENEPLVERILNTVVAAVDAPVTLKIRTGPDPDRRNALTIARLAEQAGVAALTVHGRTRVEKYRGTAEYETIRTVKQNVSIPVIANGDIHSPVKAAEVLLATEADGLMIGRASQGNPWIFREIWHYLQTGKLLAPPSIEDVKQVMVDHVRQLHRFYGQFSGVRIARKHIGWYLDQQPGGRAARRALVRIDAAADQLAAIEAYFLELLAGSRMQWVG